jgi:hypothetical protein
MSQLGQTFYRPFNMYAKLSWCESKIEGGCYHTASFRYSLGLFMPSTYAKLIIVVPEDEKKNIVECKKLDPSDRLVQVFAIPRN